MRLAQSSGVAILLLTILVGIHLRFVEPEEIVDLKPRPDALEYEEGARNLARGDGYWLDIEGKKYPPRYPPGFSLILAAARPIVGASPGAGIRVVLFSALLGMVASWALASRAGGPFAGLVAALVVAISPLDIRWSKYLMSDLPAAAACAWLGTWCLRAAARDARRREFAGIGFAAGLSASLRLSNLTIAIPIVAIACSELGSDEPASSRARRAVATILGLIVGLLPLGAYNFARFGSPFSSSYALWEGASFSLRHMWQAPLGSAGVPNGLYYPGVLGGVGDLFPLPISLLVVTGMVVAWRSDPRARRLVLFTVLFLAALLALLLPYFWQADRFLLPALPFLAACAGQAFSSSSKVLRVASTGLLAVGLLLLLRRDDGAFDASSEVNCLRQIDASVPPSAAVILRTNVFFFRDYLRDGERPPDTPRRDRLWVPVGLCDHRKAIEALGIKPSLQSKDAEHWILDLIGSPFNPAIVGDGVRTLLERGRPVYYATANREFEIRYASQLAELLQAEFTLTPLIDHELCRLFVVRRKSVTLSTDRVADRPVERLER